MSYDVLGVSPDDLPATLLDFIRVHIPSFQAAEVLVFFAANPYRDFTLQEINAGLRPAVIATSAVRTYTALFSDGGLVTETNGRFKYGPASMELELRVGELRRAYNERPVTLINAIYRLADSKTRLVTDLRRSEEG